MIEAKEWRENNYYYFSGCSEMLFPYQNKIGQLQINDEMQFSVYFENISNEILSSYLKEDRNKEEFESVKPIPLSSDILIKCGFKEHESQRKYCYIKDKIYLYDTKKGFKYGHSTYLQYLHELQNLAYSLTKRDLYYQP